MPWWALQAAHQHELCKSKTKIELHKLGPSSVYSKTEPLPLRHSCCYGLNGTPSYLNGYFLIIFADRCLCHRRGQIPPYMGGDETKLFKFWRAIETIPPGCLIFFPSDAPLADPGHATTRRWPRSRHRPSPRHPLFFCAAAFPAPPPRYFFQLLVECITMC